MNRTWSLYNRVEKLRIDDLRLDQVRTILLAVSSKKMNEWYACQEGDPHWQAVGVIPELIEETIRPKPESSAPKISPQAKASKPEERRPLFEDAPTGLSMDPTLQMDAAPIKERRSARRYVRDLSFRLSHNGKTFQTETVDISMNGISVKDDLPAGLSKNFRAELQLNNMTIVVMCSKVSEKQMRIHEADKWELLRQWLVNW